MAIIITAQNFRKEVLEASQKIPVVIDFWAEWCNPCKALTPVLEKLEQEQKGRWVLGKIDTQVEKELAMEFKVQSIPNVKLVMEGKIVDEFTGALPEKAIIDFLDRHITDPRIGPIFAKSLSEGWVAGAKAISSEKITGEKAEEILWRGAIEALEDSLSDEKEATGTTRAFLEQIRQFGSPFSDGKKSLETFLKSEPEARELVQLGRLLKREKAAEFLDELLNKTIEEQRAKTISPVFSAKEKLFLAFHILGNNDELTNEYRKKLSRALF